MTDPPPTPPPTPTPPGAASPPVAASPRRRRRSWVLVSLAVLMFAFVVLALPGYLWLTSKHGAEKISRFLTQRVVQSGNTRLSFGRLLSLHGYRVTVSDLHVDYLVDGVWRPALRSSRVTVNMGGLPFWGDLHLGVDADSVRMTVWQAANGTWKLPQFGGTPTAPKDSLLTARAVRAGIRAGHGSLTFIRHNGTRAWTAEDLRLGLHYDNQHAGAPVGPATVYALRHAGRDAWLRVDSLNARIPGLGRYALHGEAWIGGVRQLRDLTVAGPHLAVRGSGVLATAAGGDSVSLIGAVDSLAMLSRLVGRRLPDGGGAGRLTLAREAGNLRVRYGGWVRVEDARVDSLSMYVLQSPRGLWRIATASGRLTGGTVLHALSGDVDPAHHRLHLHLLADVDTRQLPSVITRRLPIARGRTRGLDATLAGVWTGPMTIDVTTGPTEIQTYHVLSARAHAHYAAGVVEIAQAQVQFPGALVQAAGTIGQKTHALAIPFTANISDLGALADVFAVPGPLGGAGTAQGRIEGTLDKPIVRASGALQNGRFLEMHARSAQISEFLSDLSGTSPHVHVELEASGASFAGRTAPHASASVDVANKVSSATFLVRGFTADTLIVGHSRTVGALTTVQIDTARVRLGSDVWQLAAPGMTFTASNGRTDFAPWVVTAASGGRFRATRLRTGPGTQIAGAFVLENFPVSTPPPVTPEGIFWRGRLAGEVEVAGQSTDPDLQVHLAASTDSASANLAITQMSLWCRVARGTALLDSLWLSAGTAGAVHGAGRFTYAADVPESLMAQHWGALSKVQADARVWADSVDLAVWTSPLRQVSVPLGGILTGGLTVRGNLGTPALAVRATVHQFSARDFVSDSLVAVGHWDTQATTGSHTAQAVLDSVVVFSGRQRTLVQGTVPATLHFPGGLVLGTSGMSVTLSADSLDMSILPAVLPVIGDAAGTMSGRIQLQGDPHAPEAAGELHVRNGLVRGFGRDEVITHIAGDVTISGHGLEIVSFTGEENEGRVSLTGAMHWGHGERTNYDFRANLTHLWVSQPGMFNGHLTGLFYLTRDSDAPTAVTPHLSGTGHVDDARITYEFGQASSGDLPLTGVYQVSTPAMTFNLHLTGDRNILLANRDASIDLALDLQSSLDYNGIPNILGNITLNRGYYTFLDTRFTGVTGTVDFTAGKIDPLLNVTAHARIRDFSKPTPMDVTLHLGGRQSESQVTLTADPVVPEEEIVRAMTLGKVASGTLAASASNFGENLLLRQFERSVLRETGLLDVFDVDNTSGAQKISVGKYLLNELFVDYQQGLNTPTSNFSVEYWLNKTIRLTGSYSRALPDGTNTTTSTTTERIRVGLKARKEF